MNDWINRFQSLRDGDTSSPRTLVMGLLVIGGGLLLLWGLVALMPASPPEPAVSSDEAGTVAKSVSTSDGLTVFTPGRIAVLVLLIAGGAGAVYLNQRSSSNSPSQPSLLQPIGELPMGPNQQLQLVRCCDEVLLLGVSQGEIRLLKSYPQSEFDAANEVALESAEAQGQPNPRTLASFAHILRQYSNGSSHE